MQFDIPKLAVPQKEGITYLSLDPDKHIAKKNCSAGGGNSWKYLLMIF